MIQRYYLSHGRMVPDNNMGALCDTDDVAALEAENASLRVDIEVMREGQINLDEENERLKKEVEELETVIALTGQPLPHKKIGE